MWNDPLTGERPDSTKYNPDSYLTYMPETNSYILFYKWDSKKDNYDGPDFSTYEPHELSELLNSNNPPKGYKIAIDASVLNSDGYSKVDLSKFESVAIIANSKEYVVKKGETIPLTAFRQPPYAFTRRIVGCCVYGVPPHYAKLFNSALRRIPFRRSTVSILNLVRNTSTIEALKSDPNLSSRIAGPEVTKIAQTADVIKQIQASAGRQLIILGHVEGEQFVIRRPDGTVQASIDVSLLVKEADVVGTTLMLVGCRTAEQINSARSGFGVVESFNSLKAISALSRATQKSQNQLEFLEALSGDGFNLVIDQKFLDSHKRLLSASIHSKWRGIMRRVADIILIFPNNVDDGEFDAFRL